MGKEKLTTIPSSDDRPTAEIEVSIVMPCLNEADTLETCITKAWTGLGNAGISGEIIVADNGSTDASKEIALSNGARVVDVAEKGYGSALMGGIEAARGRYVIMGDADDSYDWHEIPKFVEKLREGYDLVQGCRLPSGGGKVLPGAMPFLHRWWGNPMFSYLARLWFKTPVHDVHCGMRGFTKEFYKTLNQKCTGMEFATEMLINATFHPSRIVEVPITLHPDGRIGKAPHLKTFRDGWRHLRHYLLFSPRWLFLLPGVLLVLIGVLLSFLGLVRANVGGATFGVHTLHFGSLAILCGYQSILFAILTKTFAIMEGLMPEDKRMLKFFEVVNLERGLILSAIALVIGIVLLLAAINEWRSVGFGDLNYSDTMRLVIPGATLVVLGFQTVLSGFFVSILGLNRR